MFVWYLSVAVLRFSRMLIYGLCAKASDRRDVLFGFCGQAGQYPGSGTVSLPAVAGSAGGLARSSGLTV